jgi:hypothetical protein
VHTTRGVRRRTHPRPHPTRLSLTSISAAQPTNRQDPLRTPHLLGLGVSIVDLFVVAGVRKRDPQPWIVSDDLWPAPTPDRLRPPRQRQAPRPAPLFAFSLARFLPSTRSSGLRPGTGRIVGSSSAHRSRIGGRATWWPPPDAFGGLQQLERGISAQRLLRLSHEPHHCAAPGLPGQPAPGPRSRTVLDKAPHPAAGMHRFVRRQRFWPGIGG